MFTVTSDSLLAGLEDPANQTVWRDFVDRYRPLLVQWVRRAGTPDADADDLAQEILVAFTDAYRRGGYDKEKGRLRAWLFGIARVCLLNFRRRRQREPVVQAVDHGDGTDFFAAQPDADRLAELWDAEWRDAVLRQCLAEARSRVEPQTFEAFCLFARDGLSADAVGARLGMTANAVFGAKRRVLQLLREVRAEIEPIW